MPEAAIKPLAKSRDIPVVLDHYAIYGARRDRSVYEHPDLAKVIEGPVD